MPSPSPRAGEESNESGTRPFPRAGERGTGAERGPDDERVALFREHPPAWWAWPWRLPRPMTVAELIAAGSLDAQVAALFWVALERRASLLVVAGPNGAGKTVTLSALLDFLDPAVERRYVQGMAEDFAFAATTNPATTYLLCNEISDHLPIYLWGRRVRRLFELVAQGYGLAATLHADSTLETLDFLRAPPLDVPGALLAQVALVATIAVVRRDGRWLRRVSGVDLLQGGSAELSYLSLSTWHRKGDTHVTEVETYAEPLARRLGTSPVVLRAAVRARARLLDGLVARGATGPSAVRAALAAYRASGAP